MNQKNIPAVHFQALHPPAAPIKAVLFDAYGTLFDVYSISALAEAFFPGQGQALAVLWRDKQIEYTRLASMSGRADISSKSDQAAPFYQSFEELTRTALRYACQRLALPLSTEQTGQLMQQYRHLRAFPENHTVLQTLYAHGVCTGILSNGDPAMLHDALNAAKLSNWIQHVLSVASIRRYKTDPAAYALGTQALGLMPAQILFVSSNSWDALGASWWGYTTLWVNRQNLPFETLGPKPHFVSNTLQGVLRVLQLAQT